jgi:lysophospholipase L1-like esterase
LSAFTLKVGVEYPAVASGSSGTILPVTFNGRTSPTIDPGGVIKSDPLPSLFTAGQPIGFRCYLTTSVLGQKWPWGWVGYQTGEGNASGDQSQSGNPTWTNHRIYGPMAALGTVKGGNGVAVIGTIGDSIIWGNGDGGESPSNDKPGFVLRALNNAFSYARLSNCGMRANQWTGIAPRHVALGLSGCTHVIEQCGINDKNASQTAAQILASRQVIWNECIQRGIKVYATTITPNTTSTDAWATTANQTIAANDAARTTLNDNIRNNWASYGLTGYFDVADAVESARNSGKWIVTGAANYATSDGLHPSPAGHALMAAVINAATTFTV